MPKAARLIAARKRLGWSRYKLAQVCGMDQSHLMNIENGVIPNPGVKVAGRIARALGATIEEIFSTEEA